MMNGEAVGRAFGAGRYLEGEPQPTTTAPPAAQLLHETLQEVHLLRCDVVGPDNILWSAPFPTFASFGSADEAVRWLAEETATFRNAGARIALLVPAIQRNGFAIEVIFEGDRVTGLFGQLEYDFTSEEEVWPWIARALTSRYRLRIVSISNAEREWHLEPVAECSASALASGHFVLFKSLRARSSEIRQNAIWAD